jgi:hypothetical protein
LELNQLKSAPSQLLPVFSEFDRLQTCCHSFGPANILISSSLLWQLAKNLGIDKQATFSNVAKLWNARMKQKLRMFAIHQTASYKPITET